MKEIDTKKNPKGNQTKFSGRLERSNRKLPQDNTRKTSTAKETESKTLHSKPESNISVSDSNTGTEPKVYENMVIHYVDDVNRCNEESQDSKTNEMVDKKNKDENREINNNSSDLEKEQQQENEENKKLRQ